MKSKFVDYGNGAMNKEDKDFFDAYLRWERGEVDISCVEECFNRINEKIDKTYLEKYLKSVSAKERESIEVYLEDFEPEWRDIALYEAIKSNWAEPSPRLHGIVMHNLQITHKLEESLFGKLFPFLVGQSWFIKLIRRLNIIKYKKNKIENI